jgi:hypothetical protein
MKFIDFLKTPIQDSPGKTEKDFPFFPNFSHFGMKQMEPKKINAVVSHMTWVGRGEYLRDADRPYVFNAEGHSPQKVLRE